MTVSPVDGRLYISDFMSHKIIRVKTMGPVRSLLDNYEDVAGNGEECTPGEEDLCGDGGPAIQAKLRYPKGGFCWGLQQTSGFFVSRWNSVNWGAEGVLLEERELDKTVFEDFQGQFLLLLWGERGFVIIHQSQYFGIWHLLQKKLWVGWCWLCERGAIFWYMFRWIGEWRVDLCSGMMGGGRGWICRRGTCIYRVHGIVC